MERIQRKWKETYGERLKEAHLANLKKKTKQLVEEQTNLP